VSIEVKIEAETPEEFKEVVKTLFGHLIEGQKVTQVTKKEQKQETVHDWTAKLAKKTKVAMAEKKNNMQVWTSALYGWDDENGFFVPNWEEQDIIAEMKERLADGTKPGAVADILNSRGVTGKKGGKWYRNQILRTVEQDFHKNLDKFTRPDKPMKAMPKPTMASKSIEGKTVTVKLARRYTDRNTPFGWRRDVNGLIYPNEEEQQVITQWMADVATTSYHEVAKKATKKKIGTQRIKSKKWKGPEIKRILDNPIHLHYASARAKGISLDEYIAALKPKRVISEPKKKDKSQDAINYTKRLKKKKEKKKSKAKAKVRDARPVSLEDLPTAIETVTERKPTFGAAQKFNEWLPSNLRLKLADQAQFILASKLIEEHLAAEGIPLQELTRTRLLLSPEYLTCVKMYFNMYDNQNPGLFTCNPYEDDCLLMIHNVARAADLPELEKIE
tara:strand:+ start:401 stop:1735 length:1335 start_codon:yes stop_codon:yes gene_type:complete